MGTASIHWSPKAVRTSGSAVSAMPTPTGITTSCTYRMLSRKPRRSRSGSCCASAKAGNAAFDSTATTLRMRSSGIR